MIYRKSVNDIFAELHTSECGLTDDEAQIRLDRYGPNSLKEEKGVPLWRMILDQFTDPLIYILFWDALW